jgi:RNA polymerase sigma factor (sigma-70 family)
MTVMADIPVVSAEATESDAARIDRLYRVHAGQARRFAYLLTGDASWSDDLAQDAFVRLFGSIRGVRDEAALPAYLRKTIVNLVRSRHRSRAREAARLDRHARLVAPMSATDDVEPVAGPLWDAMSSLPGRQRAALVLRYWLDLSDSDIATTLGCRPSTVRSLLARGVETLRQGDFDG